ncbi:hypothetical protein CYMTET_42599 [Cymbomonas tetramitiformis]|uniref:Sulfotransferase n=1 Tax=Cymbomonas tetramitiformis TaxID=36881 RepID=A0AAE0C559_9CHLO|nr:hypothetical protein CYMTET_42599 [Cymbomonas tetramitiformis]
MSSWPAKTRIYESHHFDSGVWDTLEPREDDILICTAYKSGTTWMQQIIAQLLFNGEEPPALVPDMSMWIDLRVPPRAVKRELVEGLRTRRFLKTHLPPDALTYRPSTKYIYVARDGRDAFMSLYNHYKTANENWYGALNDTPGRVGPEVPKFDPQMTPAEYFDKWVAKGWETQPWEQDGWPFWSLFYNFDQWWKVRDMPNVLFVHFNDLKQDLAGEMRKVAKFIGTPIDEGKFPTQVEKCTFAYMKANGDACAPLGGALWEGGGKTFINKGSNGRWKDELSSEQLATYDKVAKERMAPAAAKWLYTGGPLPKKRCSKLIVGGIAAASLAMVFLSLK